MVDNKTMRCPRCRSTRAASTGRAEGAACGRRWGFMAASSAAAAIAAAVVVLVVPVTSSAQTETPTPCVQDLGTLDSVTSYVSVSGVIDRDASCTSPQRDPDEPSAVYFARRHTFTLEAASAVSFSSSGSATNSLLIEGSSSDGSGVVLARDGASRCCGNGSPT